jgi:hypothetical protein
MVLVTFYTNFYTRVKGRLTFLSYNSHSILRQGHLSAKYEFASSNSTRMTFAFDACFVWKLASLANERSGFFHIKSIAKIDAIEQVLNDANSYW